MFCFVLSYSGEFNLNPGKTPKNSKKIIDFIDENDDFSAFIKYKKVCAAKHKIYIHLE